MTAFGRLGVLTVFLVLPVGASALIPAARPAHMGAEETQGGGTLFGPPTCGSVRARPHARLSDGYERPCRDAKRRYKPRHRGLGFEVLDLESEACGVPDDAYETLDRFLDDVDVRLRTLSSKNFGSERDRALDVLSEISETLASKGFALHVPTLALADALHPRNAPGETPRFTFDCDTGGLLYLTAAENHGLPLSLVKMTLPDGEGHNYVRWRLSATESLEWDVNGRGECKAPSVLRDYQRNAMTRDEVIGYAHAIRAEVWRSRGDLARAVADYRESIARQPGAPFALNNLSWLIATRPVPGRLALKDEAVRLAEDAVKIEQIAPHLDTLACAHAFRGEFDRAIATEEEALRLSPRSRELTARRDRFKRRLDCTGL